MILKWLHLVKNSRSDQLTIHTPKLLEFDLCGSEGQQEAKKK